MSDWKDKDELLDEAQSLLFRGMKARHGETARPTVKAPKRAPVKPLTAKQKKLLLAIYDDVKGDLRKGTFAREGRSGNALAKRGLVAYEQQRSGLVFVLTPEGKAFVEKSWRQPPAATHAATDARGKLIEAITASIVKHSYRPDEAKARAEATAIANRFAEDVDEKWATNLLLDYVRNPKQTRWDTYEDGWSSQYSDARHYFSMEYPSQVDMELNVRSPVTKIFPSYFDLLLNEYKVPKEVVAEFVKSPQAQRAIQDNVRAALAEAGKKLDKYKIINSEMQERLATYLDQESEIDWNDSSEDQDLGTYVDGGEYVPGEIWIDWPISAPAVAIKSVTFERGNVHIQGSAVFRINMAPPYWKPAD